MTTNKPGSVNQQPLYGCTGCYEDYSWPAGDLRVHDGECWCDLCWAERRWLFPDQPYWDDLEPYTPAEQQPAAMPPEIPRELLGTIIDEVFDGAVECVGVIEDIYRAIARRFVEKPAERQPDAAPLVEALENAPHKPRSEAESA